MIDYGYDEHHRIVVDPIYVNAKAIIVRIEQVTGFSLQRYLNEVVYYLKRLKKDTGKYAYSMSSVVAILYYKKVITRGEAFAILEEIGGSKKRFKDVYQHLVKLDQRKEEGKRSNKVVCPVCGRLGYKVVEKGKYIRIKHYENGVVKSCYVGKVKKQE